MSLLDIILQANKLITLKKLFLLSRNTRFIVMFRIGHGLIYRQGEKAIASVVTQPLHGLGRPHRRIGMHVCLINYQHLTIQICPDEGQCNLGRNVDFNMLSVVI